MPDVGPDGLATDPGVYAVEQWGALARRCNAGRETVILESRYIQNSVQPRYLAGAPAEKVHEGFAKICSQVAVASPLLVYLRPTNVRAALLRTLAERDPEWVRWIQHAFGNNGWAARRGLSGEEAVIRFYEEWEALAGELFDRHPGPRLLVRDPQDDWNAALARIYAAVRPTLAPAGGSRAR
jgi:hypothetical protein